MKTNFSLTQIEYVLAVHKTGHFASAAKMCHVTQPTLSMQIKKLEQDLGIVIFDRSKKPILLTRAGQNIIEQLQTLLYEAKKIDTLIKATESKELRGQLKLGIIPTIAPYLLPKLLPQVKERYPFLELQIKEMQTQKIIESLDQDEIDVGCLATPLEIARIFEFPLYYEPFYVLCHADHEIAKNKKISSQQLKGRELWLLEEGHCLRNQIVDICSLKKSHHSQFEFESGSLETLKNIVENYGGLTLLPALALTEPKPGLRLIPFEKPIPSRQVGLVYRREHFKSDLIEALGEAVLQGLPEAIRKLREKDLSIVPI